MENNHKYCDGKCNECALKREPNARIITVIFERLIEKVGFDVVYEIVQDECPNLTCCFDCHIDDFCHIEGCELLPPEIKSLTPQ